jgi:hypothetical protein
MVAWLLARFGVNVGADPGVLYEDIKIRDIRKKFPPNEWFPLLAPIFERGNRQFDVWGFKSPRISRDLAKLEEHLRNPYFIFIFRDQDYRAFAQYMETSKVPYLALSYEKSLIVPQLTDTGRLHSVVRNRTHDPGSHQVHRAVSGGLRPGIGDQAGRARNCQMTEPGLSILDSWEKR